MPLRGRVLRWLSERLGARLDAVGTRSVAEFASSGQSGRRLDIASGVVVRRELDRMVLVRESLVRDRPLTIPNARAGSGSVTLGGHTFTVRWGGPEPSASARDSVGVTAPHFPLTVRAREAGDRIQLPYGSKKLKKLLLEARIPESLRGRLPVFVDARGKVLWIPGVATAVEPEAPADGSRVLHLGINDADTQ
jgi:tRNA(Ile)-lysidine synthetase-like protein